MPKPLVSVVVPLYNSANVIDGTLRALHESTFKSFEVILIDDGSTDDTKKVLNEMGWLDQVRYVYQKNKGISGARNTGMKMAQGKYIRLLDHDDQLIPDKLESMVSYLESKPECKMVYSPCLMKRMDKEGRCYVQDVYSTHMPRWLPKRYEGDIFENLFYMRIFPSTTLICKDEALNVGLFDETFKVCEDLEFFLRFGAHYDICFFKDPCVIHVVHDLNTSKRLAELYPRYAILTYERHYPILKQRSDLAEKIYRERMSTASWWLAGVLLEKGNTEAAKKSAITAIRMNPYRSKYYFKLYRFWL
jgi:glycosyltransferase involved in cell wall biosynthesis